MLVDIRWKQRFNNYLRALATLTEAVQLAEERQLTRLEEQGTVHAFEFTHELAWDVLKEYLEDKGIIGLIGPKDAAREAFRNGLIDDGQAWMDMIKARNLSSHTYNEEIAEEIVGNIRNTFYRQFELMARKFAILAEQVEND